MLRDKHSLLRKNTKETQESEKYFLEDVRFKELDIELGVCGGHYP